MTTQTGFRQDNTGSYIDKDPGATLIYQLDWTPWMSSNANARISTSTMTATPPTGATNVTIVTSGFQANANLTYVELSGGTAGNIYTITNTVTTDNGSVDVRRFRVRVTDRYL